MDKKETIGILLIALLGVTYATEALSDKANQTYAFQNQPPPECFNVELPMDIKEWDTSSKLPTIDVEWGFGNETCSTKEQCYGQEWGNDDPLPAQLTPLSIQEGTEIRFIASSSMTAPFKMRPFEVTEQDFNECDTSNGTALVSNYTGNYITVPKEHLTAGIHYFITHTDDPLFKCEFGLRLMITVKQKKCSGVGDPKSLHCWNKGRCVSSPLDKTFECACCHGFTGQYCGYQDGCYSNPCVNNGTCFALGEDSRGAIYKCICPQGFYGNNCEKEADNLCQINKCENGGTCIGNRTEYVCQCVHGYDGHHCEINKNDCSSEPCHDGICVDQVGGFKCYCTPGYGGKFCQIKYDLCTNNPCKNHGVCIQGENGYSCQCPRGYKGKDCSIKLDLCNPSPCINALECVDYGHTFECTCRQGYGGAHCEINIDECESSPCQHGGRCIDMVAGYRCICRHGIHGSHCEFVSHQLFENHEETDTEVSSPWRHRTKLQNLTLIAGTLGGAVILAMMVVGLCYCKVNETYKNLPIWIKNKGYRKQINDEARKNIKRSSVMGSRPSIDAIVEATTPAYQENTLNKPIKDSLKARRI